MVNRIYQKIFLDFPHNENELVDPEVVRFVENGRFYHFYFGGLEFFSPSL